MSHIAQKAHCLTSKFNGRWQFEPTGGWAHMEGSVHQDQLWPQLKIRHIAPDEGGGGLDGQGGQCGRLDVEQDMLTALYHHLHEPYKINHDYGDDNGV